MVGAPRPVQQANAWDVRGLACPYGVLSRDEEDSRRLHGGRRTWRAPFSFTEAIKRGAARLLVDHRPELQLASQADGTLRFWETAGGLWYEAVLDRSPIAMLAIRGASDATITGVCVRSWSDDSDVEITDTEKRVHRVNRFDLSLMVSQYSCFHESSIQVNRIHRCDTLRRQKDKLYQQMWEAVGGLRNTQE